MRPAVLVGAPLPSGVGLSNAKLGLPLASSRLNSTVPLLTRSGKPSPFTSVKYTCSLVRPNETSNSPVAGPTKASGPAVKVEPDDRLMAERPGTGWAGPNDGAVSAPVLGRQNTAPPDTNTWSGRPSPLIS